MKLEGRSGWTKLCAFLFGLIAIAYLFLERFPGVYNSIQIGLDPSWRYALNYLNHTAVVFGRDVIFTYGPLGFLLNPVNVKSNLLLALTTRLVIHGILTGSLIYYLFRRKQVLPVIIFVVAYWAASNTGIGFSEDEYEYTFLIAVCLLTCISALEETRASFIAVILNSILVASSLYMKLTLGISTLAVLTVSSAVRLQKKDKGAITQAVVTGAVYLCTTLVMGFIYFKSLSNFSAYVRRSLDIVDGFSVAMSTVGPPGLLYGALIAVAVYLCLLFFLYKWRSQSLHIGLGLTAAVYFGFKQGFVRQDGHMLLFYPFMLAAIGILILNSSNRRELTLGSSSLVIVFVLGVPVANEFNMLTASRMESRIWASEGLRNLHYLNMLPGVRRELNRQSFINLETEKLPEEWLTLMKADNVSVTPIPWELSYCAINNLRCVPFPTLQMYHAYKSTLDTWSGLQYRGSQAPEYILLDFLDIDERNMVLDAPATWRAILDNYEITGDRSPLGLRLLKKKSSAFFDDLSDTGNGKIEIGDWVSVPPSNTLLYAFINLRLSGIGWLSKEAFRIPPVTVTLMTSSGDIKQYRIIPDTLKDGLLINYVPSSMDQLESLFRHAALDRVVKFRIAGPGAAYFEHSTDVIWRKSNHHEMPVDPSAAISLDGAKATTESTSCAIDTVNGHLYPFNAPVPIDPGTENVITVSGWALDTLAHKAAFGVFVTIDEKIDVIATRRYDRPDVAALFKSPDYRPSGFSVSILADRLAKGKHTLTSKILKENKKEFFVCWQKVELEIR